MKLWLLNTNLFFKEPHQFTKFTLIGLLEQYLAENISLQRSNCILYGLKDTGLISTNEARFFRCRVFFQACCFLNEVSDSPFFYISDITNPSTLSGKSLRKKSMLEHFCTNVLKLQYIRATYKILQYAPNNTALSLTIHFTLQYCLFTLFLTHKLKLTTCKLKVRPFHPQKLHLFIGTSII